MRLAKLCVFALPLVAASCGIVQAHPGHAREVIPAESGWHYLLQPEHALVSGIGLAIVGGAIVAGYQRALVERRRQLRPLPVSRQRAS